MGRFCEHRIGRLPAIIFFLVICSYFCSSIWSDIGLSIRAAGAAAAGKPNIVLILADDMGYGDVHALNPASSIPTPHLDSLAASGMTFTDAHSPSAVCTPTRYGVLTGRYCWRTKLKRGVLGGYSPPLIDKDRKTVATLMKQGGYVTGAVGKWHLGMNLPRKKGKDGKAAWNGDPGIDFAGKIEDSPVARGFDSYFGVSASLDMAPYVYVENDRFAVLPTLQQKARPFPDFIRDGPRSKDFVIDSVLDKLTERAVSFVSEKSKGNKPFFLYFPLTAPHKPTTPHPRFKGKTKLGPYGDFMVQVDWTVGQVLKAVKDSGVEQNTVVIFTSDNGSYMYRYDDANKEDHVANSRVQGYQAKHHRANGPFRGTKADVWEAGHHVPFFVRWPGKVKAASKCTEPITHTDLLATCAAIAGVKYGKNVGEDSASLVPMFSDVNAKRGAMVINHSAAGMFAIRDGNWKLVLGNGSGGRQQPRGKAFGKPYQLFDLSKDIGETKNVAEANADVVERLTKEFKKIHEGDRSVGR